MITLKVLYIGLLAALLASGLSLQPAFTGLFAYQVGSNSRLELFDAADPEGGGINAFIAEPVAFFANFTDLSTSQPISGPAIYCGISFNTTGDWSTPFNMTYNGTSALYEYDSAFELSGNYTWNVTCDGSSGGYDVLGVTDDIMANRYEWWDNSWAYRVKLSVRNGNENVTNWPIELDLNFTDLLWQQGETGTFDPNSTRLVEYNGTGGPIHELASQFDVQPWYNASVNAAGNFVFIMNGTTANVTSRTFMLYFDTLENGAKADPDYATNLTYLWSGDEIEFNNSRVEFYLDTNRSENTSGLYRANFIGEGAQRFFYVDDTARTVEYVEYSNDTNNLSFSFWDNVTILGGPVRLTITQTGDEIVAGDPGLATGEGRMVKQYYIYNSAGPESLGTWFKVRQNFTNLAGYSIDRNSTPSGALLFDIERGWTGIGSTVDNYLGNATDPYSWYLALSDPGLEIVGFVNLEESVPEFYVTNNTAMGRVGVDLLDNSIASGDSIIEKAAIYLGRGGTSEFISIKNALQSPPVVTQGDPESRITDSYTGTDFAFFNRNETFIITVNVTYDPYTLVDHVNVSLSNGTADPSDDINISMYDDGTSGDQVPGDNVYTNNYNISNVENIGTWTATASLYDAGDLLLNKSLYNFTITLELFVNTTVSNDKGSVNRLVNATVDVMNYRQDVWHPNVTMNCTFDSGQVDQDNITDYNNGSYFLTFYSPGNFGTYTLNCTAEKNGNKGYGTDEFSAEDVETNVTLLVSPENFTADNVTWLLNQSFLIFVNATNTHNGTAYNVTLDIGLPANITSNETQVLCGDILIDRSCLINYNLTVLNTTAPANFTINLTVLWNNTNGMVGQNETSMVVTVGETHMLDVIEQNVSGVVATGSQLNIANITVMSAGNSEVENVTLNVTGFPPEFGFSFVPAGLATLGAGNVSLVQIFLLVAAGYSTGDYAGTLNVTSLDGGYEELPVNITVSGTNMTLGVSPLNFTAGSIDYLTAQNFTIDFNASNVGNVTAFGTNVSLLFSSGFIYTQNTTNFECGDIQESGYCGGTFIVTVSNGTPSGNYTVNVSAVWDNPQIGISAESTLVNITVLSNVNFTIAEDLLSGNISHGTTSVLANFTMNSTGNDPVQGIEFRVEDPAGQLENFVIVVTPNLTETAGGNLSAGGAPLINVTVTVPLSYPPGTYSGFLNITTNNSGFRNLSLQVTVPQNRSWEIDPASLFCEHPETPKVGIVCNVTVTNLGNMNATFNITPQTSASSMYNYTWTEYVGFVVENQTGFKFSVFYNVTDAQVEQYNATYQIAGQQADPAFRNITIALTPHVEPLLEVNVTPGLIPQYGNAEIIATITSQSGFAISYTRANVTRPDGTNDTILMRWVGGSTDPYYYIIGYPTDSVSGTWGDSSLRGNYSIVVFTEDVQGLNATKNESLYAFIVMDINLSSTRASNVYYQGEKGTINYRARDLAGHDVQGVNVNISVADPTNRSVNFFNGDFVTNSMGEPDLYPNFDLFSDSPIGTYNITAVSMFYDEPVGMTVINTTLANFSVVEVQPGMVLLDLEAPSESAISEGLEVVAMITDGVANVDPDTIVASLYDPLDNLILENVSMTGLSTGRYLRWYNTSSSSNQGNWRWVVTATKGSYVTTKDVYTRLSGGPFDVRDITVTDYYVPDLGITVVIENTGDLNQDAFVQWNLTREDNGTMLDAGFDTIRIDANSEYTYAANPSGISYIGQVRITFIVTYAGTERAGAYEIFTTAEEPPPGEPGPGPPGGPPTGPPGPAVPGGPTEPTKPAKLEISEYPPEISTEVGWAQYPSVTVNNTGEAELNNIVLTIDGVPLDWYTIQPRLLPRLNPGASKAFVINLLVPEGTEAKEYPGTLKAFSNETSDEKLISIIVFGSREELVRYQLEKLKKEFEEFKQDVNATADTGQKDLSRVYDIIEEIQHQIDLTEGYLDAKMFDEALDSVKTGWSLLDRGRELLRTAPPIKPVTVFFIPDWMIILILILIILILALVILLSKYRKRLERIFRRGMPKPSFAAEMVGAKREEAAPEIAAGPPPEEEEAARRREEREKLEKVLGLLEREYKEGIISEKAYNELRKRNVEKLQKLKER